MNSNDNVVMGDKAPGFKLGGTQTIDLDDYKGRSKVLLYFMREFGCHTCVGHVLQLAKAAPKLRDEGVEVLVIGGGSPQAAQKLAAKYKVPFPVLADPDREVYDRYTLGKVFSVWQKSGSFLVDEGGILVYANVSSGPGAGLDLASVGSELVRLSG
jgi:thioredoxin-dependent peroxiredoxin